MERVAFGIFVILVIVFAALEFNRWTDPQYRKGLTGSQKARRIIGTVLLLAVGGMCYAGTYLPNPVYVGSRLMQSFEMVYWGSCLLIGLAIPVVGYLEAKETLQLIAREKRRLRQDVIDLAAKEPGQATPPQSSDE